MDEHIQTMQRCLRQHLLLTPEEEIDMSVELILLGLDSMSAIALLIDVEQAFAITFPRSMLDPKVFKSGDTLLAAVLEIMDSPPEVSSTA